MTFHLPILPKQVKLFSITRNSEVSASLFPLEAVYFIRKSTLFVFESYIVVEILTKIEKLNEKVEN